MLSGENISLNAFFPMYWHKQEPYDITRDRERKRALSMVLSQSRHQEKKDAEVIFYIILNVLAAEEM